MKTLLDGSIVVAIILVMAIAYNSNYLSYLNCMSQTKSPYISAKGAAHIGAQCKTFILEKAMVN